MSNVKKPTNLKVLKGSLRASRERSGGSPLCQDDKIPKPPKFLDKIALAEWNRVSPSLFEAGLLSRLDVAALAGYCQAYSRHVRAEMAMEGKPLLVTGASGTLVKNPLLSISSMAADSMLKAARQFGLTPASRSKVVPKPKVKKDTWNDF